MEIQFKKNSNEYTYYEMRKLLNYMVDIRSVLNNNGYKIKEYGNIYCPFHLNDDSPAAKYYPDSNLIYCFSENRSYNVVDALNLVGIDYKETFKKLWDSYNNDKKKVLCSYLDNIYESRVLFKESLAKFNVGIISYDELCKDIVNTIDSCSNYIRILYNISREITEAKFDSDDYTYLTCIANLNNFKQITSGEIVNYKDQLRAYIYNGIIDQEEVVLMFNVYKNIPYGCTIRGKKNKKFIDIGNTGGVFYGLCDMDKNFRYGDPIVIVEGPKDCETYKKVFKDKNCLAMMTSNVSTTQLEVLKGLTNNIIWAADNDKPGKDALEKFKKFNSKDFKINILKHPDDIKDFGDLIPLIRNDRQKLKEFVNFYKIQINTFV